MPENKVNLTDIITDIAGLAKHRVSLAGFRKLIANDSALIKNGIICISTPDGEFTFSLSKVDASDASDICHILLPVIENEIFETFVDERAFLDAADKIIANVKKISSTDLSELEGVGNGATPVTSTK